MTRQLKRLLVGAGLVGAVVSGQWFIGVVRWQPEEMSTCVRTTAEKFSRGEDGFANCIKERADIFREHDYPDKRELLLAYQTIMITIFVGSIAFVEKLQQQSHRRGPILFVWFVLLLAILLAGAALIIYSQAVGIASYEPDRAYRQIAFRAKVLIAISGALFSTALVSLLAAGHQVLRAKQ
jgi:hypothetical protein